MTTVLDLGVRPDIETLDFAEYDFESQIRGGEITMQTWNTSPTYVNNQQTDQHTTSD